MGNKGSKMNERIKELAREAGLLVHNPTGVPTKLDKFAELIVQECCNQLREIDAMAIRKHFGVEE
jgi:hypothetical protein